MTRVDSIRSEVKNLMRASPFRRFALTLEHGDRVMLEHPANIAFDHDSPAGAGQSDQFYVLSPGISVFSHFRPLAGVAVGVGLGTSFSRA